jgi:DNA (cytosine-5)-methyltransferase 3A
MNILSLFDGISCGQQALIKAGVEIDNYYASEVDKYAIKQTQHNFPNTLQLGSVTEVDVGELPQIDLICGGSPCQSFSMAGKRNGMTTTCNQEVVTLEQYLSLKADGFEFEGQSYLFWEYVRILKEVQKVNPNVKFLLENVRMAKNWEGIISRTLGVDALAINSNLVSAQNRYRIYWTNIGPSQCDLTGRKFSLIKQPKDKGIMLNDVLEPERCVPENCYVKSNHLKLPSEIEKTGRYCVAMHGRNPEKPSDRTLGIKTEQRLEPNLTGKTNCLTSVAKDNLILLIKSLTSRDIDVYFAENGDIRPHRKDVSKSGVSELGTIVHPKNKCVSVIASHVPITIIEEPAQIFRLRRLTVRECQRLQTISEDYEWVISQSQSYKCLGNGWTVDVIAHIFKGLTP